MADDSVATGGEGDLFDRWLAHREGEDHSGGQLRASTVPPKWAPQVVVRHVDPAAPADVLDDVPVAPEPVAEEPVVEADVAEEPVAEEPVAPARVAEEPVAVADVADPVTEGPVAEEPVAEEPVAEEPLDEEIIDAEPAVEADVADLVADEPGDAEPLADEPADEGEPEPPLDPRAEPPVRLTFRPRTRARTAVGIGALLAATASVVGCYVAAREKDEASIGIAVTLWVLTGIIWAVHSGTSVTRLSVRGGQLQVIRQGVRTTIDLTSSYTPVEVHGRPGKHGWKVVFRRRDLSTFVIDPSMVDPTEFMRVLRYYRPGVDAEAK